MFASVLHQFGGPEELQLESFPDPAPRPGWAIVELKAAALNWHDTLVRQGRYDSPLPHVLGADGAGIDRETGDRVMVVPSLWWGPSPRAPGHSWEILGDKRPGTYAELVQVPRENLFPVPKGYTWAEAAALPLVGLTTFRALVTRAKLRAGESLLILGAGGGIATAAVVMGVALGCRVVVTSGSDDKIERARQLGAHSGVSYRSSDWPRLAWCESPGQAGFDVVLDAVGDWASSLEALAPGGRLVVLGASREERVEIDVRRYFFGQYDLLGTTMGSLDDMRGLMAMVAEFGLGKPVLDASFALDRAGAAHEHLEAGTGFGKVILTTT